MTTFTCPNGHTIKADDNEDVECHQCELVATWLNRRTGVVHTWTPTEDYQDACRSLNDQMDAAFDNQYFGGDW